jgi:hypothetical protein
MPPKISVFVFILDICLQLLDQATLMFYLPTAVTVLAGKSLRLRSKRKRNTKV